MYRPQLHWFAIIVAAFALLLIAAGALVTPGAALSLVTGHRHLATTVGILITGLAAWLVRVEHRSAVRVLGVATVSLVIVAGATPGPGLALLHSLVGQLVFASAVAIAVVTAKSWMSEPQIVNDSANPSLRSVTLTVPLLILLQIGLGSAYRHQGLSVVYHITCALVVVGAAMLASIFVLAQHSAHVKMRESALALLLVALIQVFVGIGAYVAKASAAGQLTAGASALIALHFAVGALTLGASVILALQVVRNVRRIVIVRVPSRSVTATS